MEVKMRGTLFWWNIRKRRELKSQFAVTVAHYYAVSKQTFTHKKISDVGLSIVVDITVLNNDLDVSWKGPFEHPSLVLLHMFQQVSRTMTWKWTESPHCANATERRQRSGVNGKQVETETENDDEERNYLQWLSQIGGTILANQGVIKGNYNGNFFVNQLILKRG
jgi:hypothetical protein